MHKWGGQGSLRWAAGHCRGELGRSEEQYKLQVLWLLVEWRTAVCFLLAIPLTPCRDSCEHGPKPAKVREGNELKHIKPQYELNFKRVQIYKDSKAKFKPRFYITVQPELKNCDRTFLKDQWWGTMAVCILTLFPCAVSPLLLLNGFLALTGRKKQSLPCKESKVQAAKTCDFLNGTFIIRFYIVIGWMQEAGISWVMVEVTVALVKTYWVCVCVLGRMCMCVCVSVKLNRGCFLTLMCAYLSIRELCGCLNTSLCADTYTLHTVYIFSMLTWFCVT